MSSEHILKTLQSPATRSTTHEYLADAMRALPVATPRTPRTTPSCIRSSQICSDTGEPSEESPLAGSVEHAAYARGVLEHARKIIDLTEPTLESEGSA